MDTLLTINYYFQISFPFILLALIFYSLFVNNIYKSIKIELYDRYLRFNKRPNLLRYQLVLGSVVALIFRNIEVFLQNSAYSLVGNGIFTMNTSGLIYGIAFICVGVVVIRLYSSLSKSIKKELFFVGVFLVTLFSVNSLGFVTGLLGNQKIPLPAYILSFLGFVILIHLISLTFIVVTMKKISKKYWKIEDILVFALAFMALFGAIIATNNSDGTNVTRPISLFLASIAMALNSTKLIYEYFSISLEDRK